MSSKRNPGPEYPDLIELAEWHEANIASLKIYKERFFEATVNPSLTILSKFRGLQDEEIHETFDLIEDEVKKLFQSYDVQMLLNHRLDPYLKQH